MSARFLTSKLPLLTLAAGLLASPLAVGQAQGFYDHESAIHLTTAQIVRTEVRAGRVTVLAEGRRLVLETDSMSPAVSAMRAGDHVVLGYRVVQGPQGAPRLVLAALQRSSTTLRTGSVTTAPTRSAAVVSVDNGAAVPSTRLVWPTASQTAPVVPWTTTAAPTAVAPPSTNGGIPLAYVVSGIPSVPLPTPAPTLALPPGTVVPAAGADLERLRAEQNFEVAAAQLALTADSIDRAWMPHRQLCMPEDASTNSRQRDWFRLLDGNLPAPDNDNCRRERMDLERAAQRFRDQLQSSVQTARGSEVLPGRIREILGRQRIDI